MSLLHFILIFCVFIGIICGSKFYDEPCDRIRRPFHLLSTEERMLFVEGYQKLRENGKLDAISTGHHMATHAGTHHGSNFFYWHSYFLWETETQIRNLGDKFKCFSLPYWDFTYDSGDE
eukprot:233682_1